MPTFNGIDPVGWIAKAEQYFKLHNTPPASQISVSMCSMEGAPLHWLRLLLRFRNPKLGWTQFKSELINGYNGDVYSNPYELLAADKQTGTVTQYIDDFIFRAAQAPALSASQLIGYFLNGLKEGIRVKIYSSNIGKLYRALRATREVEMEVALLNPTTTSFKQTHRQNISDLHTTQRFGFGPKSIFPTTTRALHQITYPTRT
ncbi:hypothetical protein JCGZ_08090 [Jatropha curcas]|uniref:Retrotransposon gag domain-containing protein n=1 Tax=Jatropha curcas TaxID=180498 RepID=A0A067KY86_JATCU|nr:hypothetical protein JCGZ_08090 [Jatropha curcas]